MTTMSQTERPLDQTACCRSTVQACAGWTAPLCNRSLQPAVDCVSGNIGQIRNRTVDKDGLAFG